MTRLFALSALAAALSYSPAALSAQKMGKDEQRAMAMGVEDAASVVKVENDPLDTSIKLSTEAFYQQRDGILKIVNNDKFLRAFINKKTGETTYQVYTFVTYGGSGWETFNRATYETSDGPVDADVNRIASDVGGCSQFGCSHREDFAFAVPESVLRWAAQGAIAGDAATWKFRLYAKSGSAGTTGLMRTEIAGLLKRVDAERSTLLKAK